MDFCFDLFWLVGWFGFFSTMSFIVQILEKLEKRTKHILKKGSVSSRVLHFISWMSANSLAHKFLSLMMLSILYFVSVSVCFTFKPGMSSSALIIDRHVLHIEAKSYFGIHFTIIVYLHIFYLQHLNVSTTNLL